MSDDWEPISEQDLIARLEDEKGQFSDLDQKNFDAWKVPTGVRARVPHFSTDGVEEVFVVARTGSIVVFFDDVEDEFATGLIDEKGTITEAGLCGELSYALRNAAFRTA